MKQGTTDLFPKTAKVIMRGIVGSHAYGLNTPASDIDYRGAYVLPTREILGIYPTKDTVQRNDPDFCAYELDKFIKLLINVNPSVLEMLYLDNYEDLTMEGRMLVSERYSFLSKKIAVTYGGYAHAQLKRLLNRTDGSWSSDTRNRYAKHARHLTRLLQQGAQLLETGYLTIKVSNPEYLFWVGEQEPEVIKVEFEKLLAKMDSIDSRLPDEPNYRIINDLVLEIRENNP